MKMKSKNNKLPETLTEHNVGGPEDSWRGKTPPSVYPASDKKSPISTSKMAVMETLGGGAGGGGVFPIRRNLGKTEGFQEGMSEC